MRGVNPGQYRHRVRIERPVLTQDAVTGEAVTAWEVITVGGATADAVPAECLTGPGREFKASGQVLGEVALRVRLRWFAGLDETHRLVWQGFAYDLRSVETDTTNRREYLLECKNPRRLAAALGDGFITEGGDALVTEGGDEIIPE